MEKVMMSLDGEMSEQDEQKFMEEIIRCNTCLEYYNIEKSFKEFLCAKLSRKTVSPSVIKDIKDKVLGISYK